MGPVGCLCRPCPGHTKGLTVKMGLVEEMRRSESRSAATRYLLPLAVLLLSGVPMAHAQTSPVVDSPATRLDRNFGNPAFGRAQGFSMGRNKEAPAAARSPMSLGSSLGRSYGAGPAGRPRGPAGGFNPGAFAGSTRLLGSRAGQGMQMMSLRGARRGTLLNTLDLITSRGYNPRFRGSQTAMDQAQAMFASWGSPEMVAKRQGPAFPATRPAGGQDAGATAPKLTMEDLVRNRLSARREIHEMRARQTLKAGDYQQACDELELADASVMNAPDARVYLKLLFAYACIAAQQYDEAFNAVSWVLSRDPKEGGNSVPVMLNKFRDVPSIYARLKDYTDRGVELDQYLARQDMRNTPAPTAMKAMMAWGKNDAANAKYYARLLADQVKQLLVDKSREQDVRVTQWLRLQDYMQLADQGGQPVSTPERALETGKRPGSIEPGRLTLDAVPAGPPR